MWVWSSRFEPPAPPEPFADLANVLSLAELRQRSHQDFRGLHPVP